MVELFANSGYPDWTWHSAASDLGLHCLPVARLGSPIFSGLKPSVKPVYMLGRFAKYAS